MSDIDGHTIKLTMPRRSFASKRAQEDSQLFFYLRKLIMGDRYKYCGDQCIVRSVNTRRLRNGNTVATVKLEKVD